MINRFKFNHIFTILDYRKPFWYFNISHFLYLIIQLVYDSMFSFKINDFTKYIKQGVIYIKNNFNKNNTNITNDDILQYALSNGIINLEDVQEKIEMREREELLSKHPYKVWEGKNKNYWYTYLPTENNNRKQVKRKSKKDLDNVIVEYWKSIRNNTFKSRFDIWIERQKSCGCSDNTISKYESDYKRFCENDVIENLDIRNIKEDDICLFYKRVLLKKEIPYRALKSMHGYINGVFKKAIIDKIIKENPCVYIDLPLFKQYCTETNKKTSTERTLSNSEKRILLSKVHNNQSIPKFAVELALYTGMRVGELSGLKWEDIDYNNNIITIKRSEKYNRKEKVFYISTTKNDKIRIIPLTNSMKDVLNRIKKEELKKGNLGEFVFMVDGERVHTRTISDCARNNTMSKEFSSTKSIHAIRRTLNSNMKCMGVSTTVASAILGHTEKVNEENYTYDVSSIEDKAKFIEKAGMII